MKAEVTVNVSVNSAPLSPAADLAECLGCHRSFDKREMTYFSCCEKFTCNDCGDCPCPVLDDCELVTA